MENCQQVRFVCEYMPASNTYKICSRHFEAGLFVNPISLHQIHLTALNVPYKFSHVHGSNSV